MRNISGFMLLAIALLAAPAWADIKVRAYTSSGSAIPALSQDGIASGATITITLNSSTARIFIYDGDSTTPNESIGAVTINGTTSASTLFVTLGNPATVVIPGSPDEFLNDSSPNATYAVNFGGLTVSTTSEREMTVFSGQISGNVTGDITVGKLRRLVAGGSVSASLIGLKDTTGGTPGADNDYAIGRVQAQSITSSGNVLANTNTPSVTTGIYLVQVNSLSGPVRAEDGGIVSINVAQDISLGSGVSIQALNDIDSIEANSITLSSISITGGAPYGIGRLKTRTGGFTGNISVPRVRDDVSDPGIQIAGTLSGDITVGSVSETGIVYSPITMSSMATTSIIRVHGSVRSNITATSGTLGRLLVTSSLGTISAPTVVTASGAIGEISALEVNGSVTSTTGGVGPVTVSALWTGNMDVTSVASFNVGHWTGGTCKIRNLVPSGTNLNFASGGLTATATLDLPGGLAGQVVAAGSIAGAIVLPTNGLIGQVIVNAANSSGDWTGSATVGGVTPSPTRYYDNLPSSLGGGAIGLAAFHMHEAACTPPNGLIDDPGDVLENSSFNSESAVPVIITHYGKIVRSNPSLSWTDCVDIQCRPINAPPGTECDWVTVTPAFVVRGPGDSGWNDPRSIGISRATGMYPKVGVYRVALKTNRIRCVDVTGTPSVVWPETCPEGSEPRFAYTFRIEPDCDNDEIGDYEDESVDCSYNPCHVDMNDDGTVDVPDIFAFLSLWFANAPRADFDKSGTVAVPDIFAYLSAWFATSSQNCPG